VVVLSEEIGESLIIGSITFARFDSGGPGSITPYNFEVCLGLTDLDTLGTFFNDNYIPGSKFVVMERDSILISALPDQDILLELDTPYSYSQGHNLLIEIRWNGCSKQGDLIYSWNWPTAARRSMVGTYSSPAGTVYKYSVPWLFLAAPAVLQSTTWGGIKALF
jgi:hypothetical protein